MNLELAGKTALITGGSQGIGLGIACRLAEEGCAVRLVGRDPGRLARAAEHLRGHYRVAVSCISADLADMVQLASVFPALADVDILVNSAGAVPRGALLDTDSAVMREAFAGKVFSAIDLCREALRRMPERGGGVVVNIIGLSGDRPNPRSIPTSVANAALIAFTQAVGSVSVDQNVRVVGVNPGLIATERTRSLSDASNPVDGAAYAHLMKSLPMGRMGETAEIADMVAFLASPRSSYVSGTVVNVDGGARFRN
jgi:3-oxoacyl-[acyl-carrier protein] reductase